MGNSVYKTIDDITRTKTSLDGTERVPARDATGDFKITVDNLKASIVSSPVKFTTANYVILDDDGYSRIEVDTTAGDITVTLPLKANNLAREIEIANVKGANKVIVVPNATDANKLSSYGLSEIDLFNTLDSIKFRESQGSGFWNVTNKTGCSMLHVREEQASGTSGGTFTQDAWRTRVLNTVKTNTITGASLASNQITLKAGKYKITSRAPAFKVTRHKSKLYNISDSVDVIHGSSEYTAAADSIQTDSVIQNSEFTITAEKVFELQHYCSATAATNGFGVATTFGFVEVYAEVIIEKVW